VAANTPPDTARTTSLPGIASIAPIHHSPIPDLCTWSRRATYRVSRNRFKTTLLAAVDEPNPTIARFTVASRLLVTGGAGGCPLVLSSSLNNESALGLTADV